MLKKVFLGLISLVVLVGIIIIGIRFINGSQNATLSKGMPKYVKEPTNKSSFPKKIGSIDIKVIDYKSAQGFHLQPKVQKYKGVIVVFGGSEGSPNFDLALSYAKQGYEVFSMYMFGQKNQPKILSKIPLEQFEDIQDFINGHAQNKETISVVGASKGSEYALNLAVHYKDIEHVILIAPSAYNFSGFDFRNGGSSWTFKGKELPYIDIQKGDMKIFVRDAVLPMILNSSITYRNVYDSAIEKEPHKQKKIIPVKNTTADLLIITGSNDLMWSSAEMAKTIAKERQQSTTVKIYQNAGHIFSGNGKTYINGTTISTGGNEKANKLANEDSQKLMFKTLESWHHKK